MNIDFFLDNITPQAVEYINSNVKTDNQKSYDKLKKIFLNNQLELTSFDDTYLHIATFDWSGIERDRNWWWQIHSFPFLNWYIDSYSLQNKEERTKYFSLCMAAIDNWNVKTKKHESPLAWHDHGTAFRTRNIVNWLIFCHTKNIDVIALGDKIELSKLVCDHLEWLSDDDNYSKYTNHGFDQAMILLTVSIMFDVNELEPQRILSRQRLKEEIKFAFTDEGVHKENSPGYQKFMLGRLKQLMTLKLLGEQIIPNLAESYIEKAEEFLRVITLPNGYLPMIGDTRDEDTGRLDKNIEEESYEVFDYSKSGYVIVKGNNKNIGDFYLLLKNAHDSNYHRHDDDLMIYLWCNGEVIFGDAGLYSHNESSKIRRFARSQLAHSVPFKRQEVERDRNNLIMLPKLYFDDENQLIIGESYISGNKITRIIDITELNQGVIKVQDEVASLPLFINYYLGENSDIRIIKRNEVTLKINNLYCKILFPSMRSVNLYKGDNKTIKESSFLSKKYGESMENSRILLSSSNPITTIVIKLELTK